ncbi:MAG TPA: staygreen family protein [Candidatus Bathyarchaeia archaeon]|nr:staygreen family protein [Candidatus Bathyarchaeia archaeon]
MSYLNPKKLHVKFVDIEEEVFSLPRRYTLTHSDKTGDMFLTIAKDYDKQQISNWYTKFMRDEVLGEWKINGETKELHLYFHICGGFIFGWAKLRDTIIRHHMKLVFQSIRYGEKNLIYKNEEIDSSPIFAHFYSKRKKFNTIEQHGCLNDYRL